LSPKPPSLQLQVLEMQGQLRIQWNRAGLATRDVQSGVLEIIDGQATTAVPLDAAKIRAGSFQYARQSEMVEVHMTVRTANGKSAEEFASFIGKPPGQASAQDSEKQKEAAELAAEAERARGDLKKEEQRSAELQRSLDQMRQTLRREEERRRVENQMPAENPRSATPAPANAGRPPVATPSASSQAPATPPAAKQAAPPPKPQPPPTATSQMVKPPGTVPERPQTTTDRPLPAQASPPPPAPPSPPQQPAASGTRPQETAPPPVPQPLQSFSGKWIYSAGSASGSPFPPETITLNLTESGGRVRGIFSGRYRAPKNSRFNGRVTFSFEGAVGRNSSKFPFESSDGMKGDIEIIRLPGRQDAIEVVWRSERDKLTFDDLYFRLP
jgi:hypothetical protein